MNGNRVFGCGDSISWGTLRDYDLLHAFVDAIHSADRDVNDMVERFYAMSEDELDAADRDSVSWAINEDCYDILNDLAPDGCYFGASEGDGSDFGFWAAEDED